MHEGVFFDDRGWLKGSSITFVWNQVTGWFPWLSVCMKRATALMFFVRNGILSPNLAVAGKREGVCLCCRASYVYLIR